MTPLMFFADRGILTRETLGEFLALGADINETNHFGRTALMLCTLNASFPIELLDIFVRNGADINTEDDDGYTALILSAEENTLTPELLNAFVAHGADINRFNDNGSSAMMCAALWSSFTDKLSEVFARQVIRIGTSLKEIFEQVNWQENGTVSVLVHVMTERMETDPATVVNFVKKTCWCKT